MFTKDQIKQLQELFKAERQSTREIVREEIAKTETNIDKQFIVVNKQFDDVDKQFANINRQFVDVNRRMDESDVRMEAGFLSIKKQQDQDRRDWTDFFHEAGLFFDEMRNKLMSRIERIENHLDLLPIKG